MKNNAQNEIIDDITDYLLKTSDDDFLRIATAVIKDKKTLRQAMNLINGASDKWPRLM